MELRSGLADQVQVEYVIQAIKKQSRVLSTDVICAYNLFYDNHPDLDENALKLLERVFVMCKYMEPEAEDVISMLLFHDYLINKASMHMFMQYISEKRYERYHNHMTEACKNAPYPNPYKADWTREDCISYYIMIRVCDKMFNCLMRTMNKNRVSNTMIVFDAYNMAKDAHNWATRLSGVPYLVHPICVASIVESIGVESSIIAASLLHDVLEDSNYTFEDIKSKCGEKIAQYVDAVTSVHKEYAASYRPSEYQCDRAEMDEKTVQKLVRTLASTPGMMFALYIKAADRIHNLSTVDPMSSIMIHDKNDQTQLDYLPLFKAFKLDYFVKEIENLMWRASDMERYAKMQAKYDDMLSRNRVFLEELKTILRIHTEIEVNKHVQNQGGTGYEVEILEKQLLPYEVYNHIKKSGGVIDNLSKRIDKRFVPVCGIDIIPTPKNSAGDLNMFVAGFVKMFESKIAMTGRTIIGFQKLENAFIFEIEDHYRNVFRCRIILREEYNMEKKGDYLKEVNEAFQADVGVKTERITVQLRNGKSISMPKGSTVIDLAFAIHEDIGYTARAATINGHKATIYNTLLDGDKVIIEADTSREDGVARASFTRHVRISWLNWVVTKRAKKKIIEFLSDKYEGDDPKNESPASTEVVERIADKYLQEIRLTR